MTSKLKNKIQGFTIIEVMIVLAIAGLIMLIVFLAVPALQRNSRNTQRSNDASRVIAAINECVNNNNGLLANCGDFNNTNSVGGYITITQNQQLTTYTGLGTDGGLNSFGVRNNRKCDASGTGHASGGGARSLVVLYEAETSGGTTPRCLGS
jgi:prepilin-type N-terminal cleavage/methylation domain-containing protein